MKKILFNCTTNIKGGTVQNSANFIISAMKEGLSYEYYFLVSRAVYDVVKGCNVQMENFFVFDVSPSKSITTRIRIRRLADNINPDLVFTMAGPAYINFNQTHLMGCSNPYILFAAAKDILFGRNILEFVIRYVHTRYQLFCITKADHFLFQTEGSKVSFMKKIGRGSGFVVPNSIGFNGETLRSKSPQSCKHENDILQVLCPFENYPHKGAHIISKLSNHLNRLGIRAHFIVTINDTKGESMDGNTIPGKIGISYIGPQKYFDMPDLYRSSDIVFMPSVLEVFSSVCTESLYFKKPLVVSNKGFNSDIVGTYASYCDPHSIESCSRAIIDAMNKVRNDTYLAEGKEYITNKFGKYRNRHKAIIEAIGEILK